MSKECVTHHACDCIQAERDELRRKLRIAREALQEIGSGWGDVQLLEPDDLEHFDHHALREIVVDDYKQARRALRELGDE